MKAIDRLLLLWIRWENHVAERNQEPNLIEKLTEAIAEQNEQEAHRRLAEQYKPVRKTHNEHTPKPRYRAA